jgi:hypothetical protein
MFLNIFPDLPFFPVEANNNTLEEASHAISNPSIFPTIDRFHAILNF